MAIIENVSTETGDVMRIVSDVPIVGILTLNNFIDDTEGEQIIDGDVVDIATTQLSNDLIGKADYLSDIITFNQQITQSEVGLIDIQKDALELEKTYKLEFTINQNTSKFFKVNLYHSNASAIVQYSEISTGNDVDVLCLITPVVSDNESNKPLRITLSNVEIENGDTVEIKDFVLNEVSTDSRYFKKEFRYSIDAGFNFTGWQDLNNVNVQNIVVSRRDQFIVEVKLTRTGLNPTGELVFNSLNIQGLYSQLPYPIYLKTFFSELFSVNDIGVLNWQVNVLEKLYKTGIMPWYVERDTGEEESISISPPEIGDIGYGALYNWYAVDESLSHGGFINGFFVPTQQNWNDLNTHLSSNVGGKLKSERTSPDDDPRWDSPNTDATDEVNFSAFPGGTRQSSGSFNSIGRLGFWWSSTSITEVFANCRSISYNGNELSTSGQNKKSGFSVRCARLLDVSEEGLSDGTYLTNVFDADGNEYRVVKIGSLAWTVENLKTTKFADETDIPNVAGNTEWGNLTTDAYAWYVK